MSFQRLLQQCRAAAPKETDEDRALEVYLVPGAAQGHPPVKLLFDRVVHAAPRDVVELHLQLAPAEDQSPRARAALAALCRAAVGEEGADPAA